jgi:hypothetical protein
MVDRLFLKADDFRELDAAKTLHVEDLRRAGRNGASLASSSANRSGLHERFSWSLVVRRYAPRGGLCQPAPAHHIRYTKRFPRRGGFLSKKPE